MTLGLSFESGSIVLYSSRNFSMQSLIYITFPHLKEGEHKSSRRWRKDKRIFQYGRLSGTLLQNKMGKRINKVRISTASCLTLKSEHDPAVAHLILLSWRRLSSLTSEDVFKMSSRRLAKASSKLFLLLPLRDAFNTFQRVTAKTVIYRRILGHSSEKFMVSVQNLQEW